MDKIIIYKTAENKMNCAYNAKRSGRDDEEITGMETGKK